MMSPEFDLAEDMFDGRTRLIVVGGKVDAAGVERVVAAAVQAPGRRLVVDLADAAIGSPELVALLDGLEEVRAGGRVLVVSPDEVLADLAAVVTVSGVVEVVTSHPDAYIALLLDDLLEAGRTSANPPGGVAWRIPVRLRSLDGVAEVQVCDWAGGVRLIGTSARWEARLYGSPPGNGAVTSDRDGDRELCLAYAYAAPAVVLLLVVMHGDTELAAIDAHLVREVDVAVIEDPSGDALSTGTLAARVAIDAPPPASDP